MANSYPGTPQHQALLECIVQHYATDERILAVCLFGSLVRGNWDQYSDLDLDAVIADNVQIDVLSEIEALCAAFQSLGERALIIVPDGDEAGDVVLSSLTELSIRYHPLATTSPNIVDHLSLLTGSLTLEAIQAAGIANREPLRSVSDHDVDRILRWAFEVNLRIKRQQFWQAERLLQFMRQNLIEVFGVSRGQMRAYHAFEAEADEPLKTALGATFPDFRLDAVRTASHRMLDLLENNLLSLSNGQLQLTDSQREVIAKIRAK